MHTTKDKLVFIKVLKKTNQSVHDIGSCLYDYTAIRHMFQPLKEPSFGSDVIRSQSDYVRVKVVAWTA